MSLQTWWKVTVSSSDLSSLWPWGTALSVIIFRVFKRSLTFKTSYKNLLILQKSIDSMCWKWVQQCLKHRGTKQKTPPWARAMAGKLGRDSEQDQGFSSRFHWRVPQSFCKGSVAVGGGQLFSHFNQNSSICFSGDIPQICFKNSSMANN